MNLIGVFEVLPEQVRKKVKGVKLKQLEYTEEDYAPVFKFTFENGIIIKAHTTTMPFADVAMIFDIEE